MPRQLKIATLGLAAFIATAITDDAPLSAEENPPGKAKVVAEYCLSAVWEGCLEDLSDRTALATMTRVDLGNGIYVDTYKHEGPDPETGEPMSHMKRVRSYRGLIPTRITFRIRSSLAVERREGADPDTLGRFSIADFNYQYETAQMAKAYARLLGGQEVRLISKRIYSWHEHYFCPLLGPCSEAENNRLWEIDAWSVVSDIGEHWVLRGEEVLETLDGPLRTLVFEHPNPSELIWYDPVSEQVVQENLVLHSKSGKQHLLSRRIRILPSKPPQ